MNKNWFKESGRETIIVSALLLCLVAGWVISVIILGSSIGLTWLLAQVCHWKWLGYLEIYQLV